MQISRKPYVISEDEFHDQLTKPSAPLLGWDKCTDATYQFRTVSKSACAGEELYRFAAPELEGLVGRDAVAKSLADDHDSIAQVYRAQAENPVSGQKIHYVGIQGLYRPPTAKQLASDPKRVNGAGDHGSRISDHRGETTALERPVFLNGSLRDRLAFDNLFVTRRMPTDVTYQVFYARCTGIKRTVAEKALYEQQRGLQASDGFVLYNLIAPRVSNEPPGGFVYLFSWIMPGPDGQRQEFRYVGSAWDLQQRWQVDRGQNLKQLLAYYESELLEQNYVIKYDTLALTSKKQAKTLESQLIRAYGDRLVNVDENSQLSAVTDPILVEALRRRNAHAAQKYTFAFVERPELLV